MNKPAPFVSSLRVIAQACVSVFAAALFLACGAKVGTATDTNTNWLDRCAQDGECGAGLQCLCGICSTECDADDDCRGQDDDAVCATKDTCSEATAICRPPSVTTPAATSGQDAGIAATESSNAIPSEGDECSQAFEAGSAQLQEVFAAADTRCSRNVDCGALDVDFDCIQGCGRQFALNVSSVDAFNDEWSDTWQAACAESIECGDATCGEPTPPSEALCQFPEPGADELPAVGQCAMVELDFSCGGLEARGERKLMEALDEGSRGCRQDSDCEELVMPGLSCVADAGDCGTQVPVTSSRIAALQLAVEGWETEICASFEGEGCPAQPILCPGPQQQREVICQLPGGVAEPEDEGLCTYRTIPPTSEPDASAAGG